MLTPKQAASRGPISLSLVYELLKAGKIPAYRVGNKGRGKWLIAEEDMDGFLASCKILAPQEPGPILKHIR